MTYFKFKKRPSKQTDHSKLIDKVDTLISEVVRLTAADERGECVCVTCGVKEHYLRMQCGHFVVRANMATRYDLRNLNVQCLGCNCVMYGMEDEHARYIDATYGKGTSDELISKGRQEKKWMPHELEAMVQELKAEAKALKLEKGFL
jgi:hypothetical protein